MTIENGKIWYHQSQYLISQNRASISQNRAPIPDFRINSI